MKKTQNGVQCATTATTDVQTVTTNDGANYWENGMSADLSTANAASQIPGGLLTATLFLVELATDKSHEVGDCTGSADCVQGYRDISAMIRLCRASLDEIDALLCEAVKSDLRYLRDNLKAIEDSGIEKEVEAATL